MKPSDNPLSPFNANYQAKIDWKKQQIFKSAAETSTKNLEKARMANANHDRKVGLVLNEHDRLLPKLFHVYTRAGSPK